MRFAAVPFWCRAVDSEEATGVDRKYARRRIRWCGLPRSRNRPSWTTTPSTPRVGKGCSWRLSGRDMTLREGQVIAAGLDRSKLSLTHSCRRSPNLAMWIHVLGTGGLSFNRKRYVWAMATG